MSETAEQRAEPTPGHIKTAMRAYAREVVLARQRKRADRSELHPGDIGLDIEGDAQVVMGLMNPDTMRAALEAAAPDTAAERDRLKEVNEGLVKALDDMTGTAQGLIVSHKVHTFYPGDAVRLADQIERAEIKLAKARAVLDEARQS